MTVEKHSLGDDFSAVAQELMHALSGQGTGELSQKFEHLMQHATSEALNSLHGLREHFLPGSGASHAGATASGTGAAPDFGGVPQGGFTPQSGFSGHFDGSTGSAHSFGHGPTSHGAGSANGYPGAGHTAGSHHHGHAGPPPSYEQATGGAGSGAHGAHGFGGMPGGYKPQQEYGSAGGTFPNGTESSSHGPGATGGHAGPQPSENYTAGGTGPGQGPEGAHGKPEGAEGSTAEDMPSAENGHPDHYGALGLGSSASESEIRTAYKKQALKMHPDKASERPETYIKPEDRHSSNPAYQKLTRDFTKMKDAYDVLSDPAARQKYDEGASAGR